MFSMAKLFILPVASAGFLLLSACQGLLSQQPPTQTRPPTQQPAIVRQEEPAPTQRSYKAGTIQTYSPVAYAEALADGKDVIIDFHANWCAICAANAPGIRAAFKSAKHANVVGFIADYDKETALENQFGVSTQSTLVKVRGGDPKSATKIGTLGPGPLTQQQVEAFIQL